MLSDEQREFLEPFTYDEWMLRETARAVGHTTGLVGHNANLESFALHARALLNFFFPWNEARSRKQGRRPRSGDIHVERLLNATWEEVSGFTRGDLEVVHNRVSDEIAHITEARATRARDAGVSQPWKVSHIHDELQKHVHRFAEVTGWTPLPLMRRHTGRRDDIAITLAPELVGNVSDVTHSTSSPYTDARSVVPGRPHYVAHIGRKTPD